ncbi:porin family protein [Autumnicola musiva]|uniref:Porin family protein n=1 Tax=Autumnicola musiva TaxID=3075589 RepID=A0ABU3D914_9FLAO|nr:porin family protein [Zunongwangia sp. F117]MDT0677840.1 porin family protein [Zunongwangia sp. F117]
MKNFFIIIFFLCCYQFSQAQLFSGDQVLNNPNIDQQRWSWGYFIGFNSYDFQFKYDDEVNTNGNDLIIEKTIGFNVGLIGNLKLNNNLDLRLEPGVSFNTRNFRPPSTIETEEINATYVHIPLLLKFSANRLNNFKPFVVGGLSTSINLSSNENNEDAATRLKTNTYNYEIGLGIDLYLPYFKFTPSLRGVFTINNEMVRTTYPEVNAMHSRAVFLNFTFQ